MEDVGIFYGYLVHSTAVWYLLWSYGILYGNYVYFFPLHQEKSGSPAQETGVLNRPVTLLSSLQIIRLLFS
jgi:hypothetical protein